MPQTLRSSRSILGPSELNRGNRTRGLTSIGASGSLRWPLYWTRLDPISWPSPASLSPTGRRSGPTIPWSVSTRRSDVAPMSWASSLTDQPCVAWLAPSWLSSTTNGPSAVDTSHPPFSPSMKLLQRPNPQKRLRLRQHQQDDALLHNLTGRDLSLTIYIKCSAATRSQCTNLHRHNAAL